jgi:hypothetical protein
MMLMICPRGTDLSSPFLLSRNPSYFTRECVALEVDTASFSEPARDAGSRLQDTNLEENDGLTHAVLTS